jgi:hypothetical protein
MTPASEMKASSLQSLSMLQGIFGSPAMGRAEETKYLLPRTSSPLGEALRGANVWSVQGLTERSRDLIQDNDADLIAVACMTQDPVAICVARETMALTADVELAEIEPPRYVWKVSSKVSDIAKRFVSAVSSSFGITLPAPGPDSAAIYGEKAELAQLHGRCILMGQRPGDTYGHYHWYISGVRTQAEVLDFWSNTTWTTGMLRQLPLDRWPARGEKTGSPGIGNRSSAKKPSQLKRWLTNFFGLQK